MNIIWLTCGLSVALFLVLHVSCTHVPSQKLYVYSEDFPLQKAEHPKSENQPVKNKSLAINQRPINKKKAISIANREAVKTYPFLETPKVVICEQKTLWLVIYEEEGLEYYIDNETGEILGEQKIPLHQNNSVIVTSEPADKNISEADAIAIARKDFFEAYGERASLFDPVPCKLTNSWRIFFEFRTDPNESSATLPNSDPPNYVISKKTGEIIYRQKY